jgi:hypothetical protein
MVRPWPQVILAHDLLAIIFTNVTETNHHSRPPGDDSESLHYSFQFSLRQERDSLGIEIFRSIWKFPATFICNEGLPYVFLMEIEHGRRKL